MSKTPTILPATAAEQGVSPGFWSIERAVAFIVGPLVSVAAGFLSLEAAKIANVQISPTAITAFAGTTALSAGAGVYKWLDGRQFPGVIKAEQLAKAGLSHLIPFMDDIKLIPGAAGEIQAVVSKGEQAALGAVGDLVPHGSTAVDEAIERAVKELTEHFKLLTSDAIDNITAGATEGAVTAADSADAPTTAASQESVANATWAPPAPDPIAPATNDPAPATPLPPPAAETPAVAGQAADPGAAPTS